MKPDNIILSGTVGSVAYGLNHEDSDIDTLGIFVAPTSQIVGLKRFRPQLSIHSTDPDFTYHEVGKFVKLACAANPTLLEMLFLEGYTVATRQGLMLVDNRHLFLSNLVRKSYGSYALDQIYKMNARGGTFGNGRGNRYKKHVRHIFRLLLQGKQLLETGILTVRCTLEQREELFTLQELPMDKAVDIFKERFAEFDKTESVLPDKPNHEEVNKILLKIRKGNW